MIPDFSINYKNDKRVKFQIEFSCDDGQLGDLEIADMLEKYNFRGTFYISNHCGLDRKQIKELSLIHDIGGHTVNHPQDLKLLEDNEDLRYEIEWNKEWLENLIGREITKFSYPRGRYNERVISAVRKAGYKYARTTVILNIDPPDDMFRVATTIDASPGRQEYNGGSWFGVAKEKFLKAKTKRSGYFHLWCHSAELSERKEFGVYKNLLEFISQNK